MLTANRLSTFAVSLAFAFPVFAQGPQLVVDRGLPKANLNDSSGSARSNVRWAIPDDGFLGDDFTVGAPGEKWVIDSIRTWTVPGAHGKDPVRLGDFYQDVRLYFGGPAGDLTPLVSVRLNENGDRADPSRVLITDAGTATYDDFGKSLRIWQVEFPNLNLTVDGGAKYRFGVWGMGRAIPDSQGKNYLWFNHASNAALSGAPQDGSDGLILQFDATGRASGDLNTEGHGWDKSADINVQVFAHRAPDSAGSQ